MHGVHGTDPDAHVSEIRPGAHQNCEGSANEKRRPTDAAMTRLCFLPQSQWVRGEGSRKTDSYPRRATDQNDAERAVSLDHSFGDMEFLKCPRIRPVCWYQVLEFAIKDRNRVKVVQVSSGFNHFRPQGRFGAS